MTTDRALVPSTAAGLTSAQILSGLHTVRSVLAPDLSDDELKLFAMVANRSGLDPFAKQVYAVKRKGRVTFQTGIDGYRSIAARTGLYDGQDEPEYGPWIESPFGHPESATVRVYRKGVTRAIAATAFWDEYKPADNDFMWQRMPRVMLAKVAEALALRKAFPYDPEQRQGIGADIYTADEMAQAGPVEPPAPQPSARERVAQRAAAIAAPEEEPDEIIGEAITPEPATPAEALAKTPQEAAEAVAVKRAARVAGLSAQEFTDAARHGGVLRGAVAKAIGCTGAELDGRVAAMTHAERGVLADELNLDWRGGFGL
jgi:phage recombination protein Bet